MIYPYYGEELRTYIYFFMHLFLNRNPYYCLINLYTEIVFAVVMLMREFSLTPKGKRKDESHIENITRLSAHYMT